MFGELIGAWILQEWAIAGKPESFEYLELGPGRGTLAKDALNAIQTLLDKVEDEADKKTMINVRFVEVSPVLSKKQAEALDLNITEVSEVEGDGCYMKASNGSNISAEWYRSFEQLPESDDISFSICNEFFDALPIHQFDFNENNRQWREVIVDTDPVDKEKLRFVTAPGDTPAAKALLPMFDNADLEGKRCVEVSPSSLIHCQWLCERIMKQGGSSLIIDYGHEGQKEDTLRGFKNHKLVEILDNPGEIDITADVNFSHLRSVAEAVGVDASESITQDAFLKNMGIETRLLMLMRATISGPARKNLSECFDYLMKEMGPKFRVMALSHPARQKSGEKIPGFYKLQQDHSAFMRAPPKIDIEGDLK